MTNDPNRPIVSSPAAKAGPPAAFQLSGRDSAQFSQQVRAGDFSGIRRFLAETRASQDWEDRKFMIEEIAPSIRTDALGAACAAEPADAALHLLLGAHYFELSSQSRGAREARLTTREQMESAGRYSEAANQSLRQAIVLDPGDPTPYAFIIRSLVIFHENSLQLKANYVAADKIAPGFAGLQYVMVNARSKKWGGSHEESMQIARAAMRKGAPGGDMAGCLFLAHFFVWQYAAAFDKDAPRADRYLRDRAVNEELNAAFDSWTSAAYRTRRSSIRYLHQAALWYYKNGDKARLRRALELTSNIPCETLWSQLGDSQKHYGAAMQAAFHSGSRTASKGGLFGWLRKPR